MNLIIIAFFFTGTFINPHLHKIIRLVVIHSDRLANISAILVIWLNWHI